MQLLLQTHHKNNEYSRPSTYETNVKISSVRKLNMEASYRLASILPQTNIDTIIYIYTYIMYIWSRRRPAIPPCYPPPATPWVASHLPPSIKISYSHMLDLNAGLVPPIHYITGYLHAAFATAYNMPIQSIDDVLLPIKHLYSSHKYQDLMCYTYVLATYYLYAIYMIPLQHPTHPTGGAWGVSYTFHHSIYKVLLPMKYLYYS